MFNNAVSVQGKELYLLLCFGLSTSWEWRLENKQGLMLMEIKGDLGRGGDLHDPIRVELLDNGEFQTLPLSDREVSYVTLTAVFLSPHFRPPCCRDVLRDSGRKLITKSLNLQFYSKVPLDKVVASASVAVWVGFFGLIMEKGHGRMGN